jgi:N-acetylmuramoyl-L-alanine amidase
MNMNRAIAAFAGLLCAISAADAKPAASRPPANAPVVLGARIGEHPDHTRFVFELSDPVQLRVFTLTNPDRVIVDMPEVLWRLQAQDRPTGRGAVKSYRYGQFRPGDSRLIVDLNAPVSPRAPMILPPVAGMGYRVVLDLYPTSQAQFEQAAGWPADLHAREAAAERIASSASPHAPARKIVVVDAGHGGIDAGTTGIDGTKEKDVVLDEAKRLAKVLTRRGYVVHLTRDSDIYIPLRERVAIARSYDADLFISLHADSNPSTQIAGASVYTLSEHGSDAEAGALASKENQSDIIAGVDLSGQDDTVSHILIDLAQRDTINRSAHFANLLVSELPRATDVVHRQPHRSAGFAVLKAPDVPAVLIELGYLSNRSDCSQLGNAAWRESVARSIASAVDRQFAPQVAGAGSLSAAR